MSWSACMKPSNIGCDLSHGLSSQVAHLRLLQLHLRCTFQKNVMLSCQRLISQAVLAELLTDMAPKVAQDAKAKASPGRDWFQLCRYQKLCSSHSWPVEGLPYLNLLLTLALPLPVLSNDSWRKTVDRRHASGITWTVMSVLQGSE